MLSFRPDFRFRPVLRPLFLTQGPMPIGFGLDETWLQGRAAESLRVVRCTPHRPKSSSPAHAENSVAPGCHAHWLLCDDTCEQHHPKNLVSGYPRILREHFTDPDILGKQPTDAEQLLYGIAGDVNCVGLIPPEHKDCVAFSPRKEADMSRRLNHVGPRLCFRASLQDHYVKTNQRLVNGNRLANEEPRSCS